GIPGMATIHANSARDAIRKLQTLPLLAGENITQDFLTPTVYSAIDYVVHVGIDNSGTRRVLEIARVNNRSENTFIELEYEFRWTGSEYRRGPIS
ncbi:MAG: CpaF family protein, partial [Actinomycetota bacterium]